MDGFGEILRKDKEFLQKLNNSMYAQYRHLQKRMERHLLGNHYFENLKTVLLGALYFQEPKIYQRMKRRFAEEIKEQILPDGVHYERSMMYHKIILEDLMRVEKALGNRSRSMRRPDQTVHLPEIVQIPAAADYHNLLELAGADILKSCHLLPVTNTAAQHGLLIFLLSNSILLF